MHRSLDESTRSLQEAILLFTAKEHEKSPQVIKKRNNYKDGNDNGKLSEKGNYKKGLRVGIWESYHDNGQLWVRGKYTWNA